MYLHGLHKNPEDLDHHDDLDFIPSAVWEKYKYKPIELKKREKILARDPKIAYFYANKYGPFKLGEPAIAKDAYWSYYYAKNVLEGPFPLGEPTPAKNSGYSYLYAMNVLNARFKLGEPAIKTDKDRWDSYARIFAL